MSNPIAAIGLVDAQLVSVVLECLSRVEPGQTAQAAPALYAAAVPLVVTAGKQCQMIAAAPG